jgi:flagellar biosynthesis protein FlhB
MQKKYRRKARLFRFIGFLVVSTSTLGAFLFYQYLVDWENFRASADIFVVNEETLKLNTALAMPFFVGLGVLVIVMLRRNRDFFSNKYSMGLLIALVLMYLIYSMIEVVLFSLAGAVVGAILDDYIFRAIARYYDSLTMEQKEIDNEFEKEKRRIKARNQAKEEYLNGSV